jgi:hypothetical protein
MPPHVPSRPRGTLAPLMRQLRQARSAPRALLTPRVRLRSLK